MAKFKFTLQNVENILAGKAPIEIKENVKNSTLDLFVDGVFIDTFILYTDACLEAIDVINEVC